MTCASVSCCLQDKAQSLTCACGAPACISILFSHPSQLPGLGRTGSPRAGSLAGFPRSCRNATQLSLSCSNITSPFTQAINCFLLARIPLWETWSCESPYGQVQARPWLTMGFLQLCRWVVESLGAGCRLFFTWCLLSVSVWGVILVLC